MAKNAGGLSQVPYALIAVPCLVLLYSPLVPNYAPMLLGRLGFSLSNFAGPLIAVLIACNLLIIPLAWAAVARLRHAGWASWLALLLIFPALVKLYFVVVPAPLEYPHWTDATVLFWFMQSVWKVCVVAGALLIFVPGRRPPRKAAAAF